jgi:chemotaxis protein methyltransferase CheR
MNMALKKFRYPDLREHLSLEVMRLTGVQLGEKQRAMVETRINKRSQDLGFRNLSEYQSYYEEHEASEIQQIISLLTTHYTYFFREFEQFEFISEKILPTLIPEVKKRADPTLRIWCAAASRGQEVYSLAMYLKYHLQAYGPGVKFTILSTDVDDQSVKIAQNGVYPRKEIREVPLAYLGNHWARGTGDIAEFVKARPSLKESVRFEQSNLLDLKDRYPGETFDLIFCRNVFIYFSPEQIRTSTSMLLKHLDPKGYFFIGISESLNGLGLDLKSEGPSIYRTSERPTTALKMVPAVEAAPAPTTYTAPTAEKRPIRVFCVDDSPTIQILMKQILRKEEGFEVVGSAMNGLEAERKLKEIPNVDVMTLDIHMPEQNGLEYLEKNFKSGHPPVVMVSSVSRDQSDLAFQTLRAGASDFIEKPALNQLEERGQEIRAKLKSAVLLKGRMPLPTQGLDEQFKKTLEIKYPERKARVMVTGVSSLKKTADLLKTLQGDQPPVYLLFEGVAPNLPAFAEHLSKLSGKTVRAQERIISKALPGEIVVVDFKTSIPTLASVHEMDRVSVSVFGEIGKGSAQLLRTWHFGHLLLEDLGGGRGAEALQIFANDVFPSSSFVYMGSEYLAKG